MSTAFVACAILIAAVAVLVISALVGFGVALGMRLESAVHTYINRRRPRPASQEAT